ncbi:hypothetical protein [Ligilactobacillus apodemi]|uniref:hypothetical protein n=1 Tax=Ligilactobacillus apodemi TaxID=307126 RepID=UPI00214BB2ED|nr:hypothetical protein [Ligilactobacillus apodemi]MCR1902258.1 hypothetical protein [Ligilactobacillus apodemi]
MNNVRKITDDFKEHLLELVSIREEEIARREYQRGWEEGIKAALKISQKDPIGGKK